MQYLVCRDFRMVITSFSSEPAPSGVSTELFIQVSISVFLRLWNLLGAVLFY
jgi:hypothetical protein